MAYSGEERCKGPHIDSYVKLSPFPINTCSGLILTMSVIQSISKSPKGKDGNVNVPGELGYLGVKHGDLGGLLSEMITRKVSSQLILQLMFW